MNIHTPTLMTVEQFIDWTLVQPRGRFELHQGRIVAMSPERIIHLDGKAAAYLALGRAIRRAKLNCHALPDGATVKIDAHTSYEPDALVYCGERLPDDTIIVPSPVLVVEVLSPWTAQTDKKTKLADYFKLPSIAHYLIVDADKRCVLHHWRANRGTIGRRLRKTGTLALDPPGLNVRIADLFEPGI
jgi:Uma2 family endonuclease